MREPVRAFCEVAAAAFPGSGRVVEFGAYQVEGQERQADLRALFAGRPYVGCDLRAGPGVDRVEDVSAPSFADGSVGTVVCFETLEHVFEVRRAFDSLHRILAPGGVLIASAPFHFHIHAHPDDYWRLTPSAWRRLLAPYAVRVVGALGPEKRPHTVLALAVKAPAPEDAEERARRLVEGMGARLTAIERARPWTRRLAAALRSLGLSKGERRERADALRARFTIEP
jgi:SAM-dependent methyltransferase